jgi:hypothetical protein
MSLLDAIKRDANTITTNLGEFSEPVKFIHPDTGLEIIVSALHTKRYLGYDVQTAQEINTVKAHVCVSEQELTALGYPTRNTAGSVAMIGRKVKASDSNGVEFTYVINETRPDDKVGTISLILGAHE